MKLPLYLSKQHLKSFRQYMIVVRTACYIYSGSWLVIEILSHFWPEFEQWSRNNLGLLITIFLLGLATGIGWFLWKCAKMVSVEHELERQDISIEIRIDDIFNFEGAFIISTNTTFDTDMSNGLISEKSLQGQFTKRYYDKEEHLDQELAAALMQETSTLDRTKPRKQQRYEIGTVAKVSPRGQLVYLVAIADLNEHGVASSSLNNVRESLGKLWYYIGNQGGFDPLIIPILGTGHSRIPVSRQQIIIEIIKSFIAACSEKKFCEKLTIVVFEEDYRKNGMDLGEFSNYLQFYESQEHWRVPETRDPVGQPV